jgi:hypothetical protein
MTKKSNLASSLVQQRLSEVGSKQVIEPGIEDFSSDSQAAIQKCRAQISPKLFVAANKAGHTLFDKDRSGYVSMAKKPEEVIYCVANQDDFFQISHEWGRWSFPFRTNGEPSEDFWGDLERDGEVHASENSGNRTIIVTVKKSVSNQ